MPKCTKECFRRHYRNAVNDSNLLFIKEYSNIFKYAMIFYRKFINEIKEITSDNHKYLFGLFISFKRKNIKMYLLVKEVNLLYMII